ncbi:MAG: IS200/IS605 family transposase [Bacteroidales bacterium]|nr:IS200/IS605 family transposase [Bacteroidales bacterium]
MSTYTQILYQIVFGTKNNERTMIDSGQESLYKYIPGILKNKKCHLYRINGVEDHIHIVTHIHPTVALAYLIKDIKIASSEYIKNENIFSNFSGWQEGYGAFTYSISAKDNLIEYVKNQKEHHRKVSFKDEYISLLKEHGIVFDEKYLL